MTLREGLLTIIMLTLPNWNSMYIVLCFKGAHVSLILTELICDYMMTYYELYTLFENSRHFSNLLFTCKLALVASFKGIY